MITMGILSNIIYTKLKSHSVCLHLQLYMSSFVVDRCLDAKASVAIHAFPRIPIDVSSADQSELSIVRETLVLLFLRHSDQSAVRFVVILDTTAYHIDWSDSVIVGSEEVPILLQACIEAWPDGTWTFEKGDSSVLLENVPIDEAKTCRASFRYTGWPVVLDMDYAASLRPIR